MELLKKLLSEEDTFDKELQEHMKCYCSRGRSVPLNEQAVPLLENKQELSELHNLMKARAKTPFVV